MDQGTLGKIGGKVDETKTSNTAATTPAKSEQAAAAPASSNDTVNLTSSAKLLERLDKTLESLPAVNSERVAEIRNAIESGNYEIDSDAIADAMIRLDRSFGE
ncbi:MAG: flagellar biosynthesis anti-sigma factor FlgM [Gammaproteobacteria bacterium]|nr:flagellar biosynthesis anti-sigma factor FlgM [Gammaproteobacteria bacterium]